MVLFPIAFIWLLCVMIWIVRNSLNEPDTTEREPRRWFPRPPRRPTGRLPGSPRTSPRSGSAARRD
jgi:hypothetical protein